MKLLVEICCLLSIGAQAFAKGGNQPIPPPSALDREIATKMFREDGMMRVLMNYYSDRGFQVSGSPQVFASSGIRYCDQNNCQDSYDVVQAMIGPALQKVTVQGFMDIGRKINYATFHDRYNNRTTTPVRFEAVGTDQVLNTDWRSQYIKTFIHKAGRATPGADSGNSRRGINLDGGELPDNHGWYYAKNLSCLESTSEVTSCSITFLNDAIYHWDDADSQQVLNYFKIIGIAGHNVNGGDLYEVSAVDCGIDDTNSLGWHSDCWFVAR